MRPTNPEALHDVVAIGVSADGIGALHSILGSLPKEFPAAVVLVMHRGPTSAGALEQILGRRSGLPVKEVKGGEPLTAGAVYVAPADRHLLVNDGHLELKQTEKIHFSRPSIDVLFNSVAKIYGNRAIGVLLSGAGRDGATGLHAIKARGGTTVVQDPGQARFPNLPRAAIAADGIDFVLPIESIGPALARLVSIGRRQGSSSQAVTRTLEEAG